MMGSATFEKRIAKELGVTSAALRWLAIAASTGTSRQRGNECTKLEEKGYAERVRHERTDPHAGLIAWHEWQITDAGREVVKRARKMGW